VVAERSGPITFYVTVLGGPTRERRNADLERLLAWAGAEFHAVDAVAARRSYARVALPYGLTPLPLVAAARLRTVVRPGQPLVERVVAPLAAQLPVRRGQVLGRVEVWAGKRLVGGRPLVAARDVARPGFERRARWYARRALHHVAALLP
jgi:D-alanyl-D-alanine carboxypeptidase